MYPDKKNDEDINEYEHKHLEINDMRLWEFSKLVDEQTITDMFFTLYQNGSQTINDFKKTSDSNEFRLNCLKKIRENLYKNNMTNKDRKVAMEKLIEKKGNYFMLNKFKSLF